MHGRLAGMCAHLTLAAVSDSQQWTRSNCLKCFASHCLPVYLLPNCPRFASFPPCLQAKSCPLGSSPQGSFEHEWLEFMSLNVVGSRARQRRRSQRSLGQGAGWGRQCGVAWGRSVNLFGCLVAVPLKAL